MRVSGTVQSGSFRRVATGFNPLVLPGGSSNIFGMWEASYAGNAYSGSPEEYTLLADMSGGGNDLTQHTDGGPVDLPRRDPDWLAALPSLVGTNGTRRELARLDLVQGADFADGQTLVAVFDYSAYGNIQHILSVRATSGLLRIAVNQFEDWLFGPGGAVGGAGAFVVVCRFGTTGRCIIHRDGSAPSITTGNYFPGGSGEISGLAVQGDVGTSNYHRGNFGAGQYWGAGMSDSDMDYLAAGFAARYAFT